MKNFKLSQLIFMALCCDLGLFGKKLIAPVANVLTDSMHIPGGIGTGFSLMFLVVAAALIERFGCASLMGLIQSVIALSFGMVGSMGALSPIGYIVPGIVIDVTLWLFRRHSRDGVIAASMLAPVSACLTANLIVFHLSGLVLLLYASVSCTSGAVFGLLASTLVERLRPVLGYDRNQKGKTP